MTAADSLRLCYVKDRWAYFTTVPLSEAWGDDWNDAPHDCNAGRPKADCVVVAFDGDLEVCGTQFGWPPASVEHPHGYSVEEINDGEIPWLATMQYRADRGQWDPVVRVMAGTTLAEFRRIVKAADGNVYEKVET